MLLLLLALPLPGTQWPFCHPYSPTALNSARAPRQRSGPRAYYMRILLRVSGMTTKVGILQACKPRSASTYLYMAAASTNRSLRVFALISTGGTASSSLHAAFNQRPPLTKTLKEGQRV